MYCLATIHVLQMTDGQQTTAVVGQWSVCNCYCVHQIFSVMVQCTRGSWYELLRGWKDTVATSYSAQPASWRCRAHIYGKWSRQNTTCWRRMSSTSSRSWIVASTHAGGVAIDASHVLTNQESDTELLKWCYFTFCFLKDDAYIVVYTLWSILYIVRTCVAFESITVHNCSHVLSVSVTQACNISCVSWWVI